MTRSQLGHKANHKERGRCRCYICHTWLRYMARKLKEVTDAVTAREREKCRKAALVAYRSQATEPHGSDLTAFLEIMDEELRT